MMLAHGIDPESNKRVLVAHAFIVAGGEITKAALYWPARWTPSWLRGVFRSRPWLQIAFGMAMAMARGRGACGRVDH